MNIRYTSALLTLFGFFASSLVPAVSPQISLRSQGQNIVHTALQNTKTHIPVTDAQQYALPSSTLPETATADTAVPTTDLSTIDLPETDLPAVTTTADALPVKAMPVKTVPAEITTITNLEPERLATHTPPNTQPTTTEVSTQQKTPVATTLPTQTIKPKKRFLSSLFFEKTTPLVAPNKLSKPQEQTSYISTPQQNFVTPVQCAIIIAQPVPSSKKEELVSMAPQKISPVKKNNDTATTSPCYVKNKVTRKKTLHKKQITPKNQKQKKSADTPPLFVAYKKEPSNNDALTTLITSKKTSNNTPQSLITPTKKQPAQKTLFQKKLNNTPSSLITPTTKQPAQKTLAPKKLKNTPSSLITPITKHAYKNRPAKLIAPYKKCSDNNTPSNLIASKKKHTNKDTTAELVTFSKKTSRGKSYLSLQPNKAPIAPVTYRTKKISHTPAPATMYAVSTLKKRPTICPTTSATHEMYPALEDLDQTTASKSFEVYPALEDTDLPLSQSSFELYPSPWCETQATEFLEKTTQPAASTKRHQTTTCLLPATKTEQPLETTSLLSPSKAACKTEQKREAISLLKTEQNLEAPSLLSPTKIACKTRQKREVTGLLSHAKKSYKTEPRLEAPSLLSPSKIACKTEQQLEATSLLKIEPHLEAPSLLSPAKTACKTRQKREVTGLLSHAKKSYKTEPHLEAPSLLSPAKIACKTEQKREAIRLLSPTKKTYKKYVQSFKGFFSSKKTTALNHQSLRSSTQTNNTSPNNFLLGNATLNNRSLNSKNAATEVHSIDQTTPIAGNFALRPEIMRSFRPHALTEALFGCDVYNGTTIHIRGSACDRNQEKDWLAEYFYLSNNFESNVCFTPRITSFLTDMSLFINLNSLCNGCFLRVQSPLVWTKWNLGMHEQIITNGNVPGAHGWRGNWTTVDTQLLSSFTDYAVWEKAATSYSENVGLVFPLYTAKLCPCGRSETALADIHVDLGVYAYEGDHYHVGIYARGVMPTGTHPSGTFLFEPVVGNGHHWELGGGINGSVSLWTDKLQSQELGLYVDGSITHLFSSHQQRVFDLKNHGPLSRYLLLTNSATAPSSITPAANITNARVQVSIPVQIDLVALINYANDVFSWNIGYNFWAHSCEKIDCCDIVTSKICDNCSAVSGLDGVTWMPYANSTIKNLGSSTLAQALSTADLDLQASRTKGSSHKILTSFNYSWIELDDTVVPFFGIGTEIEFGSTSAPSKNTPCCQQVSLSQWGLWLVAGTEF